VLLGILEVADPASSELPAISGATWNRLEHLVPGRVTLRRRARRAAWKVALAAASILVAVAVLVVVSRPPPAPLTRLETPKVEAPPPRPEPPTPTPEGPKPAPPTQAHRRAEVLQPPPQHPAPPPVEVKPEAKPEPPRESPKPPEERRPTVAAGPAATLLRSHGEVRLSVAGSRFAVKPNQPILEGQGVETVGAASGAVLRFADGTCVELWGDTRVTEVAEARDDRGKRVRLAAGILRADVVQQPEGRPFVLATTGAEARVVGTKLKLAADETHTYLEVLEGAVHLARLEDGRAVEVAAGQFAFATDLLARVIPEPRRMPMLPYPGVDQAKVDAAIARGVEWLLKNHPYVMVDSEFGAFSYDEIVLYTLLHAGLDRRHPVFQALLKGMLERKLERTYGVALQAMVLSELDAVKYQGRLAQCCQFLVDNQCDNGQWDYGKTSLFAEDHPSASRKGTATPGTIRDFDPDPAARAKPKNRITIRRARPATASGDNSNAQYAALGLRACMEAEVYPPTETLGSALRWWEKVQDADGGWAYYGYTAQSDERVPYGSMTAGGLASVLIYRHYLKLSAKSEPHVVKAKRWITENFSVRENPKMSSLPAGFMGPVYHYWLYALERSGVLGNVDKFGAHDWYQEGAARLLETQAKEGFWVDGGNGRAVSDTCFAILFLRRATAPLVASVDRNK